MKSPKNKKIIARVIEYVRQNQKQASVLVFAVIVVFGGAGIGTYKYIKGRAVQTARVLEVQTGEYGTLPAWWMSDHFDVSVCEIEECKYNSDPDGDKLTNGQEYYYRSNPTKADTNGNGQDDGTDVAQNFDPSKPGKVTFEEAASDDTIVGESLAFEEDIVGSFHEEVDISKVPLPVVADGSLDIVYEENEDVYTRYTQDLHGTINSYFPKDAMAEISLTMQSGSDLDAMILGKKAMELSIDLKHIKVPAKFTTFHKYNIAFYQTLYELLSLNGSAADMTSPEGDLWFDKAQSMYALMQKMNFEKQRLLLQ